MSYILDALRRADAERQRGQVPGLGTQPAAVASDTDAPYRPSPWGLALVAVVLGAASAAAVVWHLQSGPQAAPAAATAAVASGVAPAAPLAAALPAPPGTAVPLPAPAGLPVVVSVSPVSVPAPPPPAPPASAPATPLREPPPTPLAALGADQRRELPPLAVGGSIWSDSAPQRFVILNGQLVHEGELAAPGVVLERITPKTAVLRWRELRIELPL